MLESEIVIVATQGGTLLDHFKVVIMNQMLRCCHRIALWQWIIDCAIVIIFIVIRSQFCMQVLPILRSRLIEYQETL